MNVDLRSSNVLPPPPSQYPPPGGFPTHIPLVQYPPGFPQTATTTMPSKMDQCRVYDGFNTQSAAPNLSQPGVMKPSTYESVPSTNHGSGVVSWKQPWSQGAADTWNSWHSWDPSNWYPNWSPNDWSSVDWSSSWQDGWNESSHKRKAPTSSVSPDLPKLKRSRHSRNSGKSVLPPPQRPGKSPCIKKSEGRRASSPVRPIAEMVSNDGDDDDDQISVATEQSEEDEPWMSPPSDVKDWKPDGDHLDATAKFGYPLLRRVKYSGWAERQGIVGVPIFKLPISSVISGGKKSWELRRLSSGAFTKLVCCRSSDEAALARVLCKKTRRFEGSRIVFNDILKNIGSELGIDFRQDWEAKQQVWDEIADRLCANLKSMSAPEDDSSKRLIDELSARARRAEEENEKLRAQITTLGEQNGMILGRLDSIISGRQSMPAVNVPPVSVDAPSHEVSAGAVRSISDSLSCLVPDDAPKELARRSSTFAPRSCVEAVVAVDDDSRGPRPSSSPGFAPRVTVNHDKRPRKNMMSDFRPPGKDEKLVSLEQYERGDEVRVLERIVINSYSRSVLSSLAQNLQLRPHERTEVSKHVTAIMELINDFTLQPPDQAALKRQVIDIAADWGANPNMIAQTKNIKPVVEAIAISAVLVHRSANA